MCGLPRYELHLVPSTCGLPWWILSSLHLTPRMSCPHKRKEMELPHQNPPSSLPPGREEPWRRYSERQSLVWGGRQTRPVITGSTGNFCPWPPDRKDQRKKTDLVPHPALWRARINTESPMSETVHISWITSNNYFCINTAIVTQGRKGGNGLRLFYTNSPIPS